MRMRAGKGTIPVSWTSSLIDLPGVIVAYPVGGTDARLFIDARCDPPLHGPLLASLLPRRDLWILGAPDVGHGRIRVVGDLIPGESFTRPPAGAAEPLRIQGSPRMPEPIPVELVPRTSAFRIDAVLLDAQELVWAQTYCARLPPTDDAYLALGGAGHLLLSVDDLVTRLPFGIPLFRAGPGGLYIEHGFGLSPSLPPEARRAAFHVGEDDLVVLTRGGNHRFALSSLVPVWSLWAGAPPTIHIEEAGEMARSLTERVRAMQWEDRGAADAVRQSIGASPGVAAGLREEAARLAARGDVVAAAQIYERIGEMGTAARLYERAAFSFTETPGE
jgi:hypothetical protein